MAINVNIPTSVESAAAFSDQITSSSFAGDLIIIAIAAVLVLIYGFLLNSHTILITILSTYISWLVIVFFPFNSWSDQVNWIGSLWFKFLVLLLSLLIFSSILSLTRMFRSHYKTGFLSRWWQAILLGISHAGLLASLIIYFLPLNFLTQFSENSLKLFASDIGRFAWVIIPMLALFFSRNKKRGPGRPSY